MDSTVGTGTPADLSMDLYKQGNIDNKLLQEVSKWVRACSSNRIDNNLGYDFTISYDDNKLINAWILCIETNINKHKKIMLITVLNIGIVTIDYGKEFLNNLLERNKALYTMNFTNSPIVENYRKLGFKTIGKGDRPGTILQVLYRK